MGIRRICAAAALLAATVLLAGCGQAAEQAEEPVVELVMWHYYQGQPKVVFDQLLQEYNEGPGAEAGVRVTTVEFTSLGQVTAAVLEAAEGGEEALPLPDMLPLYSHTVVTLDGLGLVANLDNYFTQAELAEYVDTYIENCRAGFDYLSTIPVAQTTSVGMLNKTDFDRFLMSEQGGGYGYDDLRTYEGIVRVAEAYHGWTGSGREEPYSGDAFFSINSVSNTAAIIAMQMGTLNGLFDEAADGRVVYGYNEEIMRKVWDIYYTPVVRGYATPAGATVADVADGSILYLMSSMSNFAFFPAGVTTADGESHPIELYLLPPRYIETGRKLAPISMPDMCVIKSAERTERASAEFLKWLADDGQSLRFTLDATGYLPVKKSAAQTFNEEVLRIINATPEQREADWNLDRYFLSAMNTLDETTSGAYEMAVFIPVAARTYTEVYVDELSEVAVAARDSLRRDVEALAAATPAGDERDAAYQELVERYCSDEVFAAWYREFDAGMREILEEYPGY